MLSPVRLLPYRFIFAAFAFSLILPADAAAEYFRLRLAAANITSGTRQAYEEPGLRILDALDADVVMLQEFNYGVNTAADIRSMVTTAFGAEFSYYRESADQIPNGIISRYPIIASGEWDDTSTATRDFAWARIDIPGDVDLWAVSVHLLTTSSSVRNTEATALVNYIKTNIPAGDFLVIGGDFNTDTRSEAAFTTLSQVVTTSGPYPADRNGNVNTNAGRSKPYDGVYVDGDLRAFATGVVIGNSVFANGLVFDTRVYTPIAEISPAQAGDSGVTNMQHMAVVKDFLVPVPEPSTAMLCIATLTWTLSRRQRMNGTNRSNGSDGTNDEARVLSRGLSRESRCSLDQFRFGTLAGVQHELLDSLEHNNIRS